MAELVQDRLSSGWNGVIWQPEIDGLTHDVTIPCYANEAALQPDAELIIFHGGYGEEDEATKDAIDTLGDELNVAAVGVLAPFDQLEATEKNMLRVAHEAPLAVASALNEATGKKEDSPVRLVGHSQGGAVSIAAAKEAPERTVAVAAISPAGVTNAELSTRRLVRRAQFIGRLGVCNMVHSDQSIFKAGNLAAGAEIGRRFARDVRNRRLGSKLDLAFALDLAPAVANHPNALIFAAEDDKLFPYDAYVDAMTAVGRPDLVRRIAGSHASIRSPRGKEQTAIATAWSLGKEFQPAGVATGLNLLDPETAVKLA